MLRITQEADNALRIMFLLAKSGERADAPTLAKMAGIAPQFALKILRKLKEGELVQGIPGIRGGYLPTHDPADISVLQIVELIDGPLYINRCLESGFVCSRMGQHTERCVVNQLFARVNQSVAEQLRGVTLADLLSAEAALPPVTTCDL